jgi:dihydroorotate dehydrogenase
MYTVIRYLLFLLPPECAHTLALKALKVLHMLGLLRFCMRDPKHKPVSCAGLTFPNRMGLAAGLDKNGDYIDALGACGFGFIEVGTVTPKPQVGNPKPRLFRLPEHSAIINRMGFNNKGVDYMVSRLRARTYTGIVGVNIGKNKTTPNEQAVNDYLVCLEKVYPHADYITVNISSPNTEGLRDLQHGAYLEGLLKALMASRNALAKTHHKTVPLFVKIAPDLTKAEIEAQAILFLKHNIEGVIATNSTLDRKAIAGHKHAGEAGGLSGAPLATQNTQVVALLHQALKGKLPIIAVGGVCDARTAQAKIDAGATVVQVYTGWIYQGNRIFR